MTDAKQTPGYQSALDAIWRTVDLFGGQKPPPVDADADYLDDRLDAIGCEIMDVRNAL